MPFNIGALSWLGDLQKGAMAGQKSVDEHQLSQYKAALQGLAVQQAQQQQQSLPGVYRALSQLGDAPMQQTDSGGVGGFLQPPVGTQQLGQPQPSGYPRGIPPSLATPAPTQLPMPGSSQPSSAGMTPNLAGSGVNWQGESPELRQRVGTMLAAAPQDVRDASSVDSGYRTTQEQADIYERSGQGTKFMAAPPGKSLHEQGAAADWSFKTPQANQWMHQNAGKYGLGFPLGPRDPNHMQLAKLDAELDQQGMKLIQNGVPGPEVQDTTKLGMMAGRQIDPTQWGRASRKQIIDAIEKTSAGESDTIKALTFLQLNKLMAPEEKMQAQMWAKENDQALKLAIAQLHTRQAEEGLAERTRHDRELEGIAAGKGDSAGWQVMQTGDPENPFVRVQAGTGKVEPVQLPAGTTRVGTPGAAGNRPWSKDAMDSLVEQSIQGDPAVMSRLPRSGPARQQYEEAYAEQLKQTPGGIEGGTAQVSMNRLRIAEAKSAATTAGRMTVQSDFYANEAKMAADQVIEASKAVPRTEIKPINQLILAYETNTGSPQVIALGQSLNNLRNVYGKMSNPTGTGIHDADKQHFENILGASLSQGQLEAGIGQLLIEGTNMTKAAFKTQQEVLSGLLPVTPPGGPQVSGGAGPTQQNIIERGGKRWRVIGGDPNDPDVEEVK